MRDFVRRQLHRAARLGALTLALSAGTGHVSGCIYPDYCIEIGISGWKTCQRFTNATGTTAEGEVVMLNMDFNIVEGCACLTDTETGVLLTQDPTPEQAELQSELRAEVETATRQACLERALELGMVDSNCLAADVMDAIEVTTDKCTAGCVYANPPPNRRCPECVVDDEGASGESGAVTEEGGESGEGPLLFHRGAP